MEELVYRGVNVKVDVHPCVQDDCEGLFVADVWYCDLRRECDDSNWVVMKYENRPMLADADLVLRNAIRLSQDFIDQLLDAEPDPL